MTEPAKARRPARRKAEPEPEPVEGEVVPDTQVMVGYPPSDEGATLSLRGVAEAIEQIETEVVHERTERTTVRQRRHRRVTLAQQRAMDTPGPHAGGWNPGLLPDPRELREQRNGQVLRTLEFLAVRSFGARHGDKYTVQEAANILRAGPGASPLEAMHGRMT